MISKILEKHRLLRNEIGGNELFRINFLTFRLKGRSKIGNRDFNPNKTRKIQPLSNQGFLLNHALNPCYNKWPVRCDPYTLAARSGHRRIRWSIRTRWSIRIWAFLFRSFGIFARFIFLVVNRIINALEIINSYNSISCLVQFSEKII